MSALRPSLRNGLDECGALATMMTKRVYSKRRATESMNCIMSAARCLTSHGLTPKKAGSVTVPVHLCSCGVSFQSCETFSSLSDFLMLYFLHLICPGTKRVGSLPNEPQVCSGSHDGAASSGTTHVPYLPNFPQSLSSKACPEASYGTRYDRAHSNCIVRDVLERIILGLSEARCYPMAGP